MPPAVPKEEIDVTEWGGGEMVVLSADCDEEWITVETPDSVVELRDWR